MGRKLALDMHAAARPLTHDALAHDLPEGSASLYARIVAYLNNAEVGPAKGRSLTAICTCGALLYPPSPALCVPPPSSRAERSTLFTLSSATASSLRRRPPTS